MIKFDKNKKTDFLIAELFVNGNFSVSEIKSLHIENSYIKKFFSINKSEEIKIYNTLAENIKINNVNNIFYENIFYEEDFENFEKYNGGNAVSKNINLIVEKTGYIDFIFDLENNIDRYVKLKQVNKIDITFLAKFEEVKNNNIILNFENLIKAYRNFKNITGEINKLTIKEYNFASKEYNLPSDIYKNKENHKKIKEFFNIIQNQKNNQNLKLEILNYFFQNVKNKRWLEKNLGNFKNYKKIANKINNKIMCI